MTTTQISRRERLQPALDLLAANAEVADRSGIMPLENIEALRKAGAFRWSKAKSLGGDEAPALERMELGEAVARADLCSGWILENYDWHVWELSCKSAFDPLPPLRELLDGEAAIAGTGAFVPGATIEGGEIVVNGRFPFATGSGHASWLRANAVVPGGPPERAGGEERKSHIRVIAIPLERPEVTIEPTWDAVGLRASQTDTVVVTDLRLPLAFSTPSLTDMQRQDPRNEVPCGYFREPGWAFANSRIGALLTGAASGTFDLALERLGGSRTSFSGQPPTRFAAVRARMADAYLELTTARAVMRDQSMRSDQRVERGESWTAEDEHETWAGGSLACQASVRACDHIALALGGTGTLRSLPFERQMRDIRTGALHLGVNPNFISERISGFLFPQ